MVNDLVEGWHQPVLLTDGAYPAAAPLGITVSTHLSAIRCVLLNTLTHKQRNQLSLSAEWKFCSPEVKFLTQGK